MRLNSMLTYLQLPQRDSSVEIVDIVSDSRQAKPRTAFFLLPRADQSHAKNAFSKGATVFHDRSLEFGVRVDDIDQVYSKALQYFYSESFNNLKIYGVTGTNGKTSFSYMLKNLLELYEVPTGLFGTVGNSFKDNFLDTGLTSPVAADFYRFNAQNYKKGMKAVVCEVSSHALDQKRLGLGFLSGAAFTSFSQDHLDYHDSMDAYLKAKNKITTESLIKGSFIIGHSSVKEFQTFKALRKISIGDSKYSFNILNTSIDGILMEFIKGDEQIRGTLPLIGDFNAENFALALAFLSEHFGDDFFPDERVFTGFKQIPGRMERLDIVNNSTVFIDFSHTPDSLEKSLSTLKGFKKEKDLIVVFGCGGDRDKLKRPLMGKVAVSLADKVMVTSDNPRFENSETIIADITTDLNQESYISIINRAEAIKTALDFSLKKESIILIAGKGHEPYQDIKGVKTEFLDKDHVLKWLALNKDLG